MIARIAKSLSFSNVIACLALFVALGGSVYAANKISGKQIKQSSLPGNRIKPKTVPANRIKPNSLSGNQINEQTLTGISAAALADVQYQATTVELLTGGRPTTITANCPPGAYVTGGGATVSNEERAYINDSGPNALRNGWTATGFTWFSGTNMTVTAICVAVTKPGGSVTTASAGSNPSGPVYQPGG